MGDLDGGLRLRRRRLRQLRHRAGRRSGRARRRLRAGVPAAAGIADLRHRAAAEQDRALARLTRDYMTATEIIAALTPLVPGASFEEAASVDFATFYVPADRLVETCRALRDADALRFTAIIEITAADYIPRQPRFEVVYHLDRKSVG